MRRTALAIAVGSAVLLLAAASYAANLPVPGKSALAGLSDCRNSARASQRSVTFKGRMTSDDPQLRMQMRFFAYERNGRKWRNVTPPEVAIWDQAQPESRTYIFTQQIDNLRLGASYRAVIRFRWLDDTGKAVAAMRKTSSVCRISNLRPDLAAGPLTASRRGGSTDSQYRLAVGNLGKVAATDVGVEVTANGAQIFAGTVAELGPGDKEVIRFAGPPCLVGELIAKIDPAGEIDEGSEANNTAKLSCPVS